MISHIDNRFLIRCARMLVTAAAEPYRVPTLAGGVFDGLDAIEKSMGPDMLLEPEPASQQGAAAGDGEAFAATMVALRRLAPTCFRCGALASLDGYMEETSSGLEKPQSVCVECAPEMTRTYPNDIHREITALRRLGHV